LKAGQEIRTKIHAILVSSFRDFPIAGVRLSPEPVAAKMGQISPGLASIGASLDRGLSMLPCFPNFGSFRFRFSGSPADSLDSPKRRRLRSASVGFGITCFTGFLVSGNRRPLRCSVLLDAEANGGALKRKLAACPQPGFPDTLIT
jgi:hypothetical protein